MTDLLLISDVPRLSAIFNRLTDDRNVRLRIATSLERGGEELAAEKPGIVFVQARLSGLSSDILLMHLKKQLDRKRSKFVLMSNPSPVGEGSVSTYHGYLDISQDDEVLLEAVKDLISKLLSKAKKFDNHPTLAIRDISALTVEEVEVQRLDIARETVPPLPREINEPVHYHEEEPVEIPQQPAPFEVPYHPETVSTPLQAPQPLQPEQPEHDEQEIKEITYSAPRARRPVYSEFNSSFDAAVNDIPAPEPVEQRPKSFGHEWEPDDIEDVQYESGRPKWVTLMMWLVPLVVIAVIVTVLQQRRSKPSGVAVSPASRTAAVTPPKPAPPTASTAAPAPVPAQAPAAQPATPSTAKTAPAPQSAPAVAAPAAPQATGPIPVTVLPPAPKIVAATEKQPRDKVVISTNGESGATSDKNHNRPTKLPDFIPRNAQDRVYGTTNPGWERYRGHVTEFKVFRESGAIKAIQVVDRGGKGIPESFMKGVLKQLADKQPFVKETSEKKDGYEVQRGRISDDLTMVMYRDEQGGRLRAFVFTWK